MAETRAEAAPVQDIAAIAEGIIKKLKRNHRDEIELTKSHIRKYLAAANALTNKVTVYRAVHPNAEELSEDLAKEVKFLKVKLAYQATRNSAVRDFVEQARLWDCLDKIGRDMKRYNDFARYIEALVAYHKFYGGKEN